MSEAHQCDDPNEADFDEWWDENQKKMLFQCVCGHVQESPKIQCVYLKCRACQRERHYDAKGRVR